jgi:Protein of unknown function (DUF935)
MATIVIGEQIGEGFEINPGENYNIYGYANSTSAEYLRGVGQRFFQEFDYVTGLQLLYELLAHPFVLAETTKLFQEVQSLPSSVYPMQGPIAISSKINKYVEDTLARVKINDYFQTCLSAYITGVVCSELVWGGTRKDPYLASINTIPPSLFVVHSRTISFRKSYTSGQAVPFSALKFLNFNYSANINLSHIGDGVGKVLFYILRERADLNCMTKLFAKKGVTPTLLVKAETGVSKKLVENIARALNSVEDWKTLPIPKGISVEALDIKQDYRIYQYLLNENEKQIYKLISGESVVGSEAATGQKGAQEASNLRKARAISLARKVLEHINTDIIKLVVDQKFGPQSSYPELQYALPVLSKQNLATVQDAILVSQAFGYTINPSFFESNYGIDILDYGADKK